MKPPATLQSITAADGTVLTLGYQGNLLASQAWSDTIDGSVSRTYNNNFQVETQTVGSSSVRFAYDNDGLLTCAGAGCSPTPGPGDLALIRDAGNGLLTDTQLSDGTHAVTDTLSYNDFGEVNGYTYTAYVGVYLRRPV